MKKVLILIFSYGKSQHAHNVTSQSHKNTFFLILKHFYIHIVNTNTVFSLFPEQSHTRLN